MLGVIGGNGSDLTIRQIVWRYQGLTYQQYLTSSAICATLYNVQRTKATQKIWQWQEFHPWHSGKRKQKASGSQVISTMIGWCGDRLKWAQGHSVHTLFGEAT